MVNIILTGVGGQGTVLAAKVLAMAAAAKGWHVRTAETIGMAQRGGSVVSHVRMGNEGEEVLSSLVTHGTADLVVAFEPAEAARCLGYLGPRGMIVTAMTPVEPVTAALASSAYRASDLVKGMQLALYNETVRGIVGGSTGRRAAKADGRPARRRLVTVDDRAVTDALGGNRKVLNSVMLGAAVAQNVIPITTEDLRNAVAACVKPQFVRMNIDAIDIVTKGIRSHAYEA